MCVCGRSYFENSPPHLTLEDSGHIVDLLLAHKERLCKDWPSHEFMTLFTPQRAMRVYRILPWCIGQI